MPPDVQEKVQKMETKDIPLADRRRLYNQLGRRLKNKDIPAGMLEQYLANQGNGPKRFEMLKAFICDKTMTLGV